MTANPLEEAICRVLNDRQIFWMPQELIAKVEWAEVKKSLTQSDRDTALRLIEGCKERIDKKIEAEGDNKKKLNLQEDKKLLVGLEAKIKEDAPSVRQLTQVLESFGSIRCNLPNMEDFGKVIEGYGRPTAEQFFLYKIQKEKDRRRRQALIALFEVVKELYDWRIDPLEIAFFVRKIDSLTQLVEVLK